MRSMASGCLSIGVICILSISCLSVTKATDPDMYIQGFVYDGNGNPIEDAYIYIQNLDTMSSWGAYTNGGGYYHQYIGYGLEAGHHIRTTILIDGDFSTCDPVDTTVTTIDISQGIIDVHFVATQLMVNPDAYDNYPVGLSEMWNFQSVDEPSGGGGSVDLHDQKFGLLVKSSFVWHIDHPTGDTITGDYTWESGHWYWGNVRYYMIVKQYYHQIGNQNNDIGSITHFSTNSGETGNMNFNQNSKAHKDPTISGTVPLNSIYGIGIGAAGQTGLQNSQFRYGSVGSYYFKFAARIWYYLELEEYQGSGGWGYPANYNMVDDTYVWFEEQYPNNVEDNKEYIFHVNPAWTLQEE